MDAQSQSACAAVQNVHYPSAPDVGRHCTVVPLCTCLCLYAEAGRKNIPEGSQPAQQQIAALRAALCCVGLPDSCPWGVVLQCGAFWSMLGCCGECPFLVLPVSIPPGAAPLLLLHLCALISGSLGLGHHTQCFSSLSGTKRSTASHAG